MATALCINYTYPYAQRVWIARNYKGLQDKIELVPIDLQNRPAWYKETVYLENKVPSLEHNGKVLGESLDLIRYLEANFEGPPLIPTVKAANSSVNHDNRGNPLRYFGRVMFGGFSFQDPAKREFGDSFDYLENALGRFDDGPFFLGQFSWVDIAYGPFVERFQIVFSEVYKNDISNRRPKLAAYIEELSKIDAYKPTKVDPEEFVEVFKKWFLGQQ